MANNFGAGMEKPVNTNQRLVQQGTLEDSALSLERLVKKLEYSRGRLAVICGKSTEYGNGNGNGPDAVESVRESLESDLKDSVSRLDFVATAIECLLNDLGDSAGIGNTYGSILSPSRPVPEPIDYQSCPAVSTSGVRNGR